LTQRERLRRRQLSLLLALVGCIGACRSEEQGLKGIMSNQQMSEWDQIPLDSYDETPCSPVFPDFSEEVQGILINAPKRVGVGFDEDGIDPDSRIPLCVAMQFPMSFFSASGDVFSHVSVVMVDRKTGQSFSTTLALSRPVAPDQLNESIPPEVLAASTEQMFINVNLVNYIPLPPVKTIYDVYATIAEEKSNSVTIEIR